MNRASAKALTWLAIPALLGGVALAEKNKSTPAAEAVTAAPAPAAPGIRREPLDGATLTTAVLPGHILELTPAPASDGAPRLYALVRLSDDDDSASEAKKDEPRKLPPCPEPGRLALYRVDAAEPPRLELVIDGLPDDVQQLEIADLDGDGAAETMLRRPGEILVVRDGTLHSLLEDPGLLTRPLPPAGFDTWPTDDGRPRAVALSVGRLELFGPGEGGSWSRLASAELPIETSVFEGRGMSVWSNALSLGQAVDGRLLYATPPTSVGQRRLRASSIALSTGGEAETIEAWLHLPEPEELLEHEFLVSEGRPLLLVLTKAAGKLDLFGEKRVRLYTFERDRSRLGRPPVWQAQSRANLWQETHAELEDIDADGRDDLVIAYWKGLTGDRIVFDVYRGVDSGWFAAEPITTAFDVKDADRSILLYGGDATGDGRADLVLSAGGRLVIHAGLASRDGGEVVSKKPLPLPELALISGGETYVSVGAGGVQTWSDASRDGLRIADLDGDGAAELVQRVPGELDEVRIIALTPGRFE